MHQVLAVEVKCGNAVADGFYGFWRGAFNGVFDGVEKSDCFFWRNDFLHMHLV